MAAIVSAGLAGYAGPSTTPWLVLVAWLSLRARGLPWGAIGLRRPERPWAALAAGVAAGGLYQWASLALLEPAIARWVGEAPDLEPFRILEGDPLRLALALLAAWLMAALGEEVVYRGYLLERLAGLGGGGRVAWAGSLVAVSAIFGLGHLYQGAAGVAAVAVNGLAFGLLYLAAGRNLWVPVVAHGTVDTVGFVLIYLGRYPGL